MILRASSANSQEVKVSARLKKICDKKRRLKNVILM